MRYSLGCGMFEIFECFKLVAGDLKTNKQTGDSGRVRRVCVSGIERQHCDAAPTTPATPLEYWSGAGRVLALRNKVGTVIIYGELLRTRFVCLALFTGSHETSSIVKTFTGKHSPLAFARSRSFPAWMMRNWHVTWQNSPFTSLEQSNCQFDCVGKVFFWSYLQKVMHYLLRGLKNTCCFSRWTTFLQLRQLKRMNAAIHLEWNGNKCFLNLPRYKMWKPWTLFIRCQNVATLICQDE